MGMRRMICGEVRNGLLDGDRDAERTNRNYSLLAFSILYRLVLDQAATMGCSKSITRSPSRLP